MRLNMRAEKSGDASANADAWLCHGRNPLRAAHIRGLHGAALGSLVVIVMQIRPAREDDAVAACEVLRRSITELCVADHNNDPAILEAWLDNKTPDHVRSWIVSPDNVLLVATEGETILAVGAVTRHGEILLNYVSPDARFRGVSKALLKELEIRALALGKVVCVLTSTRTARDFYLTAGYRVDRSVPVQSRTGGGERMTKRLC